MEDLDGLLSKASREANLVPQPTDLDRFAAFVGAGAIITSVSPSTVTAEREGLTEVLEVEGGLSEDHFRRLGYDALSRARLAQGVLRRLLESRDVGAASARWALKGVPEATLVLLVEQFPFETVAEALVTKAAEFKRPEGSGEKKSSRPTGRDEGGVSPSIEAKLDAIHELLERIATGRTQLPPEYLSALDAARFLGVEPPSLEHLRRTRKIRAIQVGDQRGFVYAVSDLRDFASQRTLKTASESLKGLEGRRRGRR